MSMQSLPSGNMTWLTIQSCWFSHSPKKKLESQLLPRGSLQLEPYHKTDTTGTTALALAASGVGMRARVRWCGASVNQPTMEKSQCLNSLDFSRGWQVARGGRQCATGTARRRRRPTARRRLLCCGGRRWWVLSLLCWSWSSSNNENSDGYQACWKKCFILLQYCTVYCLPCHLVVGLLVDFAIRVNSLIYENRYLPYFL